MFAEFSRFVAQMSDRTLVKLFALAVFSVFIYAENTSPVFAQSSDVPALLDRINRLEADLNNVQRKVFQGQDVPAPRVQSSGSSITGGGEAAALLSTRIDTLEEEQRQVTGRLEEVGFKIDQLTSRLDKLILDIDFRLSEIEQRQSGVPLVNTSDAGQVQSPANGQTGTLPTTTVIDSSAITAVGGDLPKGSKVLGTLRVPSSTAVNDGTPGKTVTNVAPNTDQQLASLAPADQYNNAISLIRKDDYVAAEKAFTTFLEGNSDHALAGNAQYWLGETFYVRGDYPNAASAFLHGYQTYPKNSKAADNLLKLAMTLGRMDQKVEACATFQQLDKQFTKLPARLSRIANREKQKFGCS